ncbi:MAG: hypothetical protein K6B14_07970 [Lachnospiraceae bacterium]|nr:hypothetical protein [Lachnospiraceae bacterium]
MSDQSTQATKKKESERFLDSFSLKSADEVHSFEAQEYQGIHDFISDYDTRARQMYSSSRPSFEVRTYESVPDHKIDPAPAVEPEMGYKARKHQSRGLSKSKDFQKKFNADKYKPFVLQNEYTGYMLQCDSERIEEGKNQKDPYATDAEKKALWEELRTKRFSAEMFSPVFMRKNYRYVRAELEKLEAFCEFLENADYDAFEFKEEDKDHADMLQELCPLMQQAYTLSLYANNLQEDDERRLGIRQDPTSAELVQLNDVLEDLEKFIRESDNRVVQITRASLDQVYPQERQSVDARIDHENSMKTREYKQAGVPGSYMKMERYAGIKGIFDLMNQKAYGSNVEKYRGTVDSMLKDYIHYHQAADDYDREAATYDGYLRLFFQENGDDVNGADTYQGDARNYYLVLNQRITEAENKARVYDAYIHMLGTTLENLIVQGDDIFKNLDVNILSDSMIRKYGLDPGQIVRDKDMALARSYSDTATRGLEIYTKLIKRRYESESPDSQLRKRYFTADDMIAAMTAGNTDYMAMKEGEEDRNARILELRIIKIMLEETEKKLGEKDITPEEREMYEGERTDLRGALGDGATPLLAEKYQEITDYCSKNASRLARCTEDELAAYLPELTELMRDVSFISEMAGVTTGVDKYTDSFGRTDIEDITTLTQFLKKPPLMNEHDPEKAADFREDLAVFEANHVLFMAQKSFLSAMWEKARFAAITKKDLADTDLTQFLTPLEKKKILTDGEDPNKAVLQYAAEERISADAEFKRYYDRSRDTYRIMYVDEIYRTNMDDLARLTHGSIATI